MKKDLQGLKTAITVSVINFLFISSLFAQAPDLMSYQAVIRDSGGDLVRNSAVGVRISILQGTFDASAVYAEEFSVTTNDNGLVSLVIGSGSQGSPTTPALLKSSEDVTATVVSGGDFSSIDWSDGPYYIKVETDPTGSTNYTISGTSQLLSVPYAKYAESSGNVKFRDGTSSADAVYTSGKVGIGTNSPSADLDIFNSSTNAIINLFGWNGTRKAWFSRFSDRLHIASSDIIQFGVGGPTNTDVMINKYGNVVIGKQSGETTSRLNIYNSIKNDIATYAIKTTVDGSGTAFHYGMLNSLSGEGSGTQTGVQSSIDNSGNGKHYASYSELYGSGSGVHYGAYNFLRGDGTGGQFGISNVITNKGNSTHFGCYSSLSGSGSGIHYGTYNTLIGSGEGSQYGMFIKISNSGNGLQMGSYSEISGNGSGDHYGYKNYLKGEGAGKQYGVYNNVGNSGDARHYGVYNSVWGDGNGSQYGSYSDLSGTGSGDKFGTYNIIRKTAGGTHYAVYGDAQKAGSYAGYFNGDVKVTNKLKSKDSGDADMKAYVYGRIYDKGNGADAEIVNEASSDGFSVKESGLGHYIIDLDHAATDNYTVVATLNGKIGFISALTYDSYITIDVYNKDGGRFSGLDEALSFSFVVYKK